ncbi:H(+)-transporting V0 sector ATPase subunit e [Puccinia graminis f. sp. tritici]|uniref:H(+)-transporting V0 sector ATPase subunit e n=1 Tax=Puccinia graminis f. sp. tritici TaxID=56615 RepID=A0A5B0RNR0_PUCGR|nr:H(+)-transporting V0 sector ATPase subunit e [Puccinia graminis f. sp. tritici]
MGGWLIFIVLILAVGLSFLGWVSAPKGDDQIVIRTAVIATITCCYLMWAIVYLAQLHPLIHPNIDAAPQTKKPGSIISAANFHSSSSSITSCHFDLADFKEFRLQTRPIS